MAVDLRRPFRPRETIRGTGRARYATVRRSSLDREFRDELRVTSLRAKGDLGVNSGPRIAGFQRSRSVRYAWSGWVFRLIGSPDSKRKPMGKPCAREVIRPGPRSEAGGGEKTSVVLRLQPSSQRGRRLFERAPRPGPAWGIPARCRKDSLPQRRPVQSG